MKTGFLADDRVIKEIRSKVDRKPWAERAYRHLRREAEEVFLPGSASGRMAEAMRSAALVYAISGEEPYAARTLEVLRQAKTFGPLLGSKKTPTHDFGCNSLVAGGQIRWLILAADLLWDHMADADRSHVIEDLVIPAVCTIRANNRGDSNWQTAHNMGMLCAGFFLGDTNLVQTALDDPDRGLRRHMAVAFRPDGGHWEGSMGYHFHTLEYLLFSAEACRRAGIDLYNEGGDVPLIKRMLDLPISIAFPDRSLPINGDSKPSTLRDFASHYEAGYARYRDPAYGWIVQDSARTSLYSLLWGQDEPEARIPESRSAHFAHSGWTVLKEIEGQDYWDSKGLTVILDHGPHGDWHGHPDKLSIELFAGGVPWVENDGSPAGYANQQHWGYFRRTLSKSTVVVDFQDQVFSRSTDNAPGDLERTGSLREIHLGGAEKRVSASVDWVYENVQYKRTLRIDKGVLFDAFDLDSQESRTYDYILHGRGTVEPVDLEMPESSLSRDGGGYEYLIGVRGARVNGEWRIRFLDGGWPDGNFVPSGRALEVRFEAAPETEAFIGYAPSHIPGIFKPFVLVRRVGRSAGFRAEFRASTA